MYEFDSETDWDMYTQLKDFKWIDKTSPCDLCSMFKMCTCTSRQLKTQCENTSLEWGIKLASFSNMPHSA